MFVCCGYGYGYVCGDDGDCGYDDGYVYDGGDYGYGCVYDGGGYVFF